MFLKTMFLKTPCSNGYKVKRLRKNLCFRCGALAPTRLVFYQGDGQALSADSDVDCSALESYKRSLASMTVTSIMSTTVTMGPQSSQKLGGRGNLP